VCSEPCSHEFQQRRDHSASNTAQDLVAQRHWRIENSDCPVLAVAPGHAS
jgi:hypothetical protein